MKTSELFRAAKETISTHNRWVKHYMHSNSKRCLLGAIDSHQSLFGSIEEIEFLEKIVREFLKEKHPGYVISTFQIAPQAQLTISQFNDMPETTHADVMEVLDRAIKKAEEEEAATVMTEELVLA